MESKPSRGSQALQRFFLERGNQALLVERTGLKQYQLSKFASGARSPGPRDRAAIEDAIGLNWRAWDEEPVSESEASAEPMLGFRDPPASTGTDGVG